MAIISANRFSKMNGNFIIAANESYGVEDMGRILVENERNDQAIFTAALMSDMHEIKCRTEGTLLESELQSLSESSVKEFFNSIIEKLKKFWAKIKGFFKRAYAMITAYVVRNGKAFIAANRKELNKLSDATEIKGKVYIPISGNVDKNLSEDIDWKYFNIGKDGSADEKAKSITGEFGADASTSEMTKSMLKKAFPKYDEEENFYKCLQKANYKQSEGTTKLKDCGGLHSMMAMLENGMANVKEIKKTEKGVEKQLQDAIKKLQKTQQELSRSADDQAKKDEAGKMAQFYKSASTAMTNAMSTAISARVKMEKFRLAQARIALARAIAKNNTTTESTLLESEIMQIIEDASEMEDDTPAPGEDPEVDTAAQKLADAVEEMIDSAAEEAADNTTEGGEEE